MLAVVGKKVPERLRGFILRGVVDDLLALLVIATVYTDEVVWQKFWIAVALFVAIAVGVQLRLRLGLLFFGLGVASWVAMFSSGVDPLGGRPGRRPAVLRHPGSRSNLEEAPTGSAASREQPPRRCCGRPRWR